MKQALVRHTDFLAGGGGGNWEDWCPRLYNYRLFKSLLSNTTILSVSSHPSLQHCDRPAYALTVASFELLLLHKATSLVSTITLTRFVYSNTFAHSIGLIPYSLCSFTDPLPRPKQETDKNSFPHNSVFILK